MRDQAIESQNAVQKLSQKVEAQSKSVEDTTMTVNNLLIQLEEFNSNFGNIQADILTWKENEERFIGDEVMKIDIPETGNLIPVIPISGTPSHDNVNIVFGETSETWPIPPTQPERSEPLLFPLNGLITDSSPMGLASVLEVADPAIRANAGPSNIRLRRPESEMTCLDLDRPSDVQGPIMAGYPVNPGITDPNDIINIVWQMRAG